MVRETTFGDTTQALPRTTVESTQKNTVEKKPILQSLIKSSSGGVDKLNVEILGANLENGRKLRLEGDYLLDSGSQKKILLGKEAKAAVAQYLRSDRRNEKDYSSSDRNAPSDGNIYLITTTGKLELYMKDETPRLSIVNISPDGKIKETKDFEFRYPTSDEAFKAGSNFHDKGVAGSVLDRSIELKKIDKPETVTKFLENEKAPEIIKKVTQRLFDGDIQIGEFGLQGIGAEGIGRYDTYIINFFKDHPVKDCEITLSQNSKGETFLEIQDSVIRTDEVKKDHQFGVNYATLSIKTSTNSESANPEIRYFPESRRQGV